MPIAPERCQIVFRKVERDLLKLASETKAESVHSLRMTARRLQTLLEELIPKRDRNQKKLLKMLLRIRKRAGKVRNFDVQLAALRSLKIPQEPRRKTQLMHSLIELRGEHEQRLRKLLNKGVLREIRRRLEKAAEELNLEGGRDPLVVAHEILARVARPAGPLTEDVLHQYRVLVKRARYAAEFAAQSPKATRLIGQLERMQDAVGNWHDWLTLTHTAGKSLGDIHESPLVAVLHNVTGAKFRNAVAALSIAPTLQSPPKPAIPAPIHSRRSGDKVSDPAERKNSAA